MGNFYFRTSQRPGIHRTLLMWSGLSPHLTRTEKPVNAPEVKSEVEGSAKDRENTVQKKI